MTCLRSSFALLDSVRDSGKVSTIQARNCLARRGSGGMGRPLLSKRFSLGAPGAVPSAWHYWSRNHWDVVVNRQRSKLKSLMCSSQSFCRCFHICCRSLNEIIIGNVVRTKQEAAMHQRLRPKLAMRSIPSQAFAHSGTQEPSTPPSPSMTAYERVLRYPDGRERRIRYPVPREEENGSCMDSGDLHETLNVWKSRGHSPGSLNSRNMTNSSSEDIVNMLKGSSKHPFTETGSSKVGLGTGKDETELPDSPLALLRLLTSPEYKEAQNKMIEDVRNSYDILNGAPWPAPRPLFLLATVQPNREEWMTHTLRTHIPRKDLENELNLLFRKKDNSSSDPIISCGEVVDGVIAFEDESMAEEYGHGLEQDGALRVSLVESNSHEIFRTVNEVKGVVILLKRGAKVPTSRNLAASLRARSPVDGSDLS